MKKTYIVLGAVLVVAVLFFAKFGMKNSNTNMRAEAQVSPSEMIYQSCMSGGLAVLGETARRTGSNKQVFCECLGNKTQNYLIQYKKLPDAGYSDKHLRSRTAVPCMLSSKS